MHVAGKIVVVTGGARGIGEAMVRRFAAEGAAGIAVSDIDQDAAAALAADIARPNLRTMTVRTDVTSEGSLLELIDSTEQQLGPIDLFCSNAGGAADSGIDVPDAQWDRLWRINVLSHVYAARVLVPRMKERKSGYLLNTCSAAGLLGNRSPAYASTKAAAVSVAEWLAIECAGTGIGVSALCPKGVLTTMLKQGLEAGSPVAQGVLAGGDVIDPEQVAEAVISGLADERFLILPHPEVAGALVEKATNRDEWITTMHQMWTPLSPVS